MADLFVGAIDCSFNYCGWSLLRRNSHTNKAIIEATGIVETPTIAAESKSLQDILQAKELAYGVDQIIGHFMGATAYQKAFAYEVPTGSQSGRAATCLGMTKGIIASALMCIENSEYPLNERDMIVPVMPSTVHKHATGKLKATKDEIMAWVLKRFHCQTSIVRNKKRKQFQIEHRRGSTGTLSPLYSKGQFEHIADSLVIADITMDELIELRRRT